MASELLESLKKESPAKLKSIARRAFKATCYMANSLKDAGYLNEKLNYIMENPAWWLNQLNNCCWTFLDESDKYNLVKIEFTCLEELDLKLRALGF